MFGLLVFIGTFLLVTDLILNINKRELIAIGFGLICLVTSVCFSFGLDLFGVTILIVYSGVFLVFLALGFILNDFAVKPRKGGFKNILFLYLTLVIIIMVCVSVDFSDIIENDSISYQSYFPLVNSV
jgi:NADH:ubiquinone oxidoreductase subunit 6 (subunit J)